MELLSFTEPLQWRLSEQPKEGSPEEDRLGKVLMDSLWGSAPTRHPSSLASFLDHYFEECSLMFNADRLSPERTHQEILDLITFVRTRTTISREDLIRDIRENGPTWLRSDTDCVNDALELGIRLWLLVDTDKWTDRQSLEEFISQSTRVRNFAAILDPSFNAYNLERVGGFRIMWTNCLQDHLSLDNTHTALYIFHQIAFLNSYQDTAERQVYPPGFLKEAAETIALLFPISDLRGRRWMRRLQRRDNVDIESGLLPQAPRDIQHYQYWGNRLLILKEAYDQKEPENVTQWIFDRRKPNQRYTFWIAICALLLALVFGLIQSIAGILQVIYAHQH